MRKLHVAPKVGQSFGGANKYIGIWVNNLVTSVIIAQLWMLAVVSQQFINFLLNVSALRRTILGDLPQSPFQSGLVGDPLTPELLRGSGFSSTPHLRLCQFPRSAYSPKKKKQPLFMTISGQIAGATATSHAAKLLNGCTPLTATSARDAVK